MKKLILILALLPAMAYAQFPIEYDFTTGSNGWSFNSSNPAPLTAGWDSWAGGNVITTTVS